MYCLVDFRNRPEHKYTFAKQEQARECLKRIRNNPLGVTVFFADGRREYFENGLPAMLRSSITPALIRRYQGCLNDGDSKKNIALQAGLPRGFFASSDKTIRIEKGCHTKYRIREMGNLDGVLKKNKALEVTSAANWKKKSAFPLFMLGNRKVYASLAIVSFVIFSFSFYFQNQYGENAVARSENIENALGGRVAGATDDKSGNGEEADSLDLTDDEIVMSLLGKIQDAKSEEFETEILKYVKGRPMEDMAPYIAKQPRTVAAFLVGIAMKESKFGTYSPKLGGRDCHNYWGFKGGGVTTSGGYTCFDTPEQAIEVVGRRIARLVDGGRTNPSAMVVWKCGSTCSWDNPENVRKWIADVGVNFYKINDKKGNS